MPPFDRNRQGAPAQHQLPKDERLGRLAQRAFQRRRNWEDHWQEIYALALPDRENFGQNEIHVRGEDRSATIYDETAVEAVPRFASRLSLGLFPRNGRAFKIEPGAGFTGRVTPGLRRKLDQITDLIHDALRASNFVSELDEAMVELAVGTANLIVEPGPFAGDLVFTAVPLTQVALLPGTAGQPALWARKRHLTMEEFRLQYPRAEITAEMRNSERHGAQHRQELVKLVEVCRRDTSRPFEHVYEWKLLLDGGWEVLQQHEFKGLGSLPWITSRWATRAGEVYGRGPLYNVFPAVRRVNLVTQLILENAEMSINGVVIYDDDGVFNPDNVLLGPGAMIPRAPGSSIDGWPNTANFDLSQLLIEQMQARIKKGLFVDELDREAKTPLSAYEVSERIATVAQDLSSPTGRLVSELMMPLVQRVLYILKEQGVVEIPAVDGKQLRLRPTSPLLRAQDQQDVADYMRFAEIGQASAGPEVFQLKVNQSRSLDWLAKKMGIPAELLNSEQESAQALQRAAQLVGQASQAGVTVR